MGAEASTDHGAEDERGAEEDLAAALDPLVSIWMLVRVMEVQESFSFQPQEQTNSVGSHSTMWDVSRCCRREGNCVQVQVKVERRRMVRGAKGNQLMLQKFPLINLWRVSQRQYSMQ